jgi:hypothetical protein
MWFLSSRSRRMFQSVSRTHDRDQNRTERAQSYVRSRTSVSPPPWANQPSSFHFPCQCLLFSRHTVCSQGLEIACRISRSRHGPEPTVLLPQSDLTVLRSIIVARLIGILGDFTPIDVTTTSDRWSLCRDQNVIGLRIGPFQLELRPR